REAGRGLPWTCCWPRGARRWGGRRSSPPPCPTSSDRRQDRSASGPPTTRTPSEPARAYSSGVAFEVGADAYSAFMGRYSEPLADLFVQWAGVGPGRQALDVGCGPGALTARLVGRLGPARVIAGDPSASFVAAVRRGCRCPTAVSTWRWPSWSCTS